MLTVEITRFIAIKYFNRLTALLLNNNSTSSSVREMKSLVLHVAIAARHLYICLQMRQPPGHGGMVM